MFEDTPDTSRSQTADIVVAVWRYNPRVKDPACARFNIVIRQGGDGGMQLVREPIREMPAELKRVIEEQQ
jgi:hypothetical protein